MEARYQRQIRSGYEYDKLFPTSDGEYKIVNKNGTVKKDTVPLMVKTATENVKDTKKIAPYLKGDSREDTCRNIWDFIYNHIQYRLDKAGTEEIRTPARTWRDRKSGVDCDCYSVFASSILLNLGIPHKFRVTKYAGDWQHVYVIVPKENAGYYTIDPVLDKFNYEKPFADNFDKTMEEPTIDGMPLALLSGYGSDDNIANQTELLGYINGDHIDGMFDEDTLSGPEDIEAAGKKAMDAIYKNLVATRAYIMQNPASVLTQGGAANNLKMLNYAIAKWNTPERDTALNLLAKKEEEWTAATGRSESTSGLGYFHKKFFTQVKDTVKKVTTAVKTTAQAAGSGIKKGITEGKRAATTFIKKAGEGIKKAVKLVVRFNPVVLAMRGGFLLALRVNLFHLATKLAPGYSGDTKAKDAIDRITKLFVDTLQGKPESLKKAILIGAKKGLSGLGEPVTTSAAIIAAATPIATALIAAKKSGVKVPQAPDAEGAGTEGFIKKIIQWLKGKFTKGVPSADELARESAGEGDKGASSTNELTKESAGEGDGKGSGESKGVVVWVKKNPVMTAAMAIGIPLAAWAIYKLATGKNPQKQRSGLSGHKKMHKSGRKKIEKLQLT